MTAGRKKKPAHMKLLEGTARADRTNKNAPKPEMSRPTPPRHLSQAAVEIFGRLADYLEGMGYAAVEHSDMLGLVAVRLEEVEICTEILNREGLTHTERDVKGNNKAKPRPEQAIRNEAARHAQSLLAEFGLSAAMMGKIVVPNTEGEGNPWGNLDDG